MGKTSDALYPHPFSRAYWRQALYDFHQVRNLVFTALMVALCIILSRFSITLQPGLKLSWGFLARSLCALVTGPVTAVVFGIVEDTLSFILTTPDAPYFPGYMLTTVLGNLIYAFCFYRARLTICRIAVAKTLTNVLNVFLGSLWSAILYGKGYILTMSSSALKNTVLLPVQALLLVFLFSALLPIFHRAGLVPDQGDRQMPIV